MDNRDYKPYPKSRRHHYYSPEVAGRPFWQCSDHRGDSVIRNVRQSRSDYESVRFSKD